MAGLTANIGSWGMFLAGLVLLIVVLMRNWNRYYRRARQSKPRQSAAPHKWVEPPRRHLSDAPPEFAQWEVEMHETARELTAELNSKISVLRAVVNMADEATARLETAIRKTKTGIH